MTEELKFCHLTICLTGFQYVMFNGTYGTFGKNKKGKHMCDTCSNKKRLISRNKQLFDRETALVANIKTIDKLCIEDADV